MKKILASIMTIAAVLAIGIVTSLAFFSDTETSKGNSFVAGEVDLKVDSTAHYAGLTCTGGIWTEDETGKTARPDLLGSACLGSWESADLGATNRFFDLNDLKPGDSGENTISLKVQSNPVYMCAIIDNMQDLDNTQTEPEAVVDPDGLANGELSEELRFFAWAEEDGDNVWEAGEPELFSNLEGPASDVIDGVVYPLFTPDVNGGQTFPAGITKYIGLYWCYGDIVADGNSLSCSGEGGTNLTQTDSLSADITFYVEQARNNPDFACPVLSPLVTSGYSGLTQGAGVRFKGYNTGGEFYLGTNLGIGYPGRVEANYNDFQNVGQKTYQVMFVHNVGTNSVMASISSPDTDLLYDFDTDSAPLCPVANWNTMDILIRDSKNDSGTELKNVMLNAFDLGDIGTLDKAGTPGFQNWTISGFDFSQDFVLTADLVVDGYTGNESIKTEFNVGCLP